MNRRAMNILSTFVLWLSAWMLTWCSLDFSASSSLCVGVVALSEEHVESVEILSDQTAAASECEAMPDQTAADSESEAMEDQTAADSESEAMEDQTAADSENEAMADKAAVVTESEAMEDKAAVDSESERKQEDAVIDSECSVKSGTGTESQNGYIPDPVAKTDLIEPVDKVLPFSSDVPPQKKPKCIVILHQYGVMHPGNYNVDSDGIWQSSSKVTQSGLRQMRALGLWMHDMYGSIIGSSFDSEKMHSMAAQYRSAIDSADSMLRGLFPDTLASFIQHGNSEINLMLMPWTFPSFILHKNQHPLYNMESWKKFYQAYFSSGLNDELDLIQLDRALGTKPLCQTESTLIECLLFAYDMGRYWKSEGLSCPEIICSSENWVRLQKAQQFITHYQFLELRDPFRSNIIPSLGGLVAQGIFETLRKHPEHKFIQLSSHDITLAGLYHALGIIRDGSYEDRQHVSEFGEAIILEIYPDESFRVVRAVPGIASKTAAGYSYSGEYLDCKLEGENCSLKNWELIVERNYAPRNVSSIYPCAVLEEEFIYAKCQATQFLDAPFIAKQIHPTQACIEYRKACPAFGCEANKSIASHVVDTSDPSRPCLKVVTDDAINHEPVYPPSDTITSNTPESTTTGRYATSPKLYVAFIVVFVALLFTLSLLVLTWLRPCRSVEHIPLHDHLELRDHDCDASRFNR